MAPAKTAADQMLIIQSEFNFENECGDVPRTAKTISSLCIGCYQFSQVSFKLIALLYKAGEVTYLLDWR